MKHCIDEIEGDEGVGGRCVNCNGNDEHDSKRTEIDSPLDSELEIVQCMIHKGRVELTPRSMLMLHNVRRILNLDDGAGWRGVDSDIGIDLQLVWRVSSRLEATSYGGSAPEKVERRGKWRGGGDDWLG